MSMTGFKSSVLREETATVWLVLLQTFAANNEIKVIGPVLSQIVVHLISIVEGRHLMNALFLPLRSF
jgi:hypothetical protein